MIRTAFSIFKASVVMATVALAMVQLSGCGGSGSSTGTLKVAITDKQSDDFAKVVVSIREVRVVPNGMENAQDSNPGLPVIASFSPARVIDVMELQFVQQALGEKVLPAGTYHQIRLILEPNVQGQEPANYLILNSDPATKIPLDTPSGQQTGLKIVGDVDVRAGIINAIAIDFDPNTAIVAMGNGKYNFKPTGIRIVQMADVLPTYGSITGTVMSSFKDWSSATVSVKRRGDINDVDPIAAGKIFSHYTSGAWQGPFAAFVPPSTASVNYKTFVAANGFRLYSSSAVTVLQGQATDLGAISLVPSP